MEIALLLISIFVLSLFLGVELINKVPPTLHTPLMSASNAISGITIIGAIESVGTHHHAFVNILGFIAIIMATINVVGGYTVTNRMLEMFKRK